MLENIYKRIKYLLFVHRACRESDGNYCSIFAMAVFYKSFYKKNIFKHQNVSIKGVENIAVSGILNIGTDYVGFCNHSDSTFLNIQGVLNIKNDFSIGRGSRFDIGKKAVVNIDGGYINSFSTFIIMYGLTIGKSCAISWNCQFLDEDFHIIEYSEKKDRDQRITIGDHVWIGCHSSIYQGTIIPNGCIVASNSVVRGVFTKENCIIAGNPARVIKENVLWK